MVPALKFLLPEALEAAGWVWVKGVKGARKGDSSDPPCTAGMKEMFWFGDQ